MGRVSSACSRRGTDGGVSSGGTRSKRSGQIGKGKSSKRAGQIGNTGNSDSSTYDMGKTQEITNKTATTSIKDNTKLSDDALGLTSIDLQSASDMGISDSCLGCNSDSITGNGISTPTGKSDNPVTARGDEGEAKIKTAQMIHRAINQLQNKNSKILFR